MFEQKVIKLVRKMILSTLPEIQVEPGMCRYNFRCHLNAVHDALTNDDEQIAMCFYLDTDQPIIHFVNYHNGKYIDNTLGQWSNCYKYYLIKMINKKDYYYICKIFTDYRKELKQQQPFYIRWFNDTEF